MRYRDLYLSGPSLSEVTHRETFMKGEDVPFDITLNYSQCKNRCDWLPPPIPRSLRTVFHFKKTRAAVPTDASPPTGPGAASEPEPRRATAAQEDAAPPARRRYRKRGSFAEAFARLPLC